MLWRTQTQPIVNLYVQMVYSFDVAIKVYTILHKKSIAMQYIFQKGVLIYGVRRESEKAS